MSSFLETITMSTLLSPKGRVSFPNVYEASVVNEGDKPKYSVVLVFDPENMDEQQRAQLIKMKEAANKVAREAFKVGIGERHADGAIIKSPFRKTEEKPKFYDPGKVFVRFANKYKPNVVDASRRPIGEETDDFYAGCWAHVSYTCYAYEFMGNMGVSFSLGNIQKTGDDEPFAGRRTNADDDFDVLEDAPVTTTPAGDDDIPF